MHRALPSFARSLLLSALVSIPFAASAPAAPPPAPDHWVGTWAAAPVATPNIVRQPTPVPTGSTIDPNQAFAASATTLRLIVHLSLGGPQLRVILSNEFGADPLTIGAAHVALSAGGSSIDLLSAGGLTFSGRNAITIPPGALAVSDPVDMKLSPGADLAVSLFLPAQPLRIATLHTFADQTSYTAPGNVVGAKTLESAATLTSWPFLKGVDVLAPAADAAIVAFGDSITDGALSTKDTNARWPDILAHRLQADKKTAGYGVLNEGIGGNRILHDVTGPSALARFDRDVISQAGVRYVILLEGINDIGHATDPNQPYDPVSADDLIAGYTQLIERAHTHGIKVVGATLTPYTGAKYMSPQGEQMRQALNTWIRKTTLLDGTIDFEKVTQDPANPAMYLPAYDSGDHLHPKDAGYKAMGDSIDLKLFEQK